ncbi:MAG: hypothetical protein IPG92_10800 [Flavobacteriales bacterium]|nr:hypothetical protein [Flavobacteriales bacterium]
MGTNAPHPSALLDVDAAALPAAGKRGLLIPRMTTAELTAIPSPATGLLVYDSSLNAFWYFDGTVWTPLGGGTEVDPTWDGAAVFAGATWRSGDVGLGMTAAPNSKLQVVGRVFIDNSTFTHAIAGNPALTADGALGEDIMRIRDVGANNRLLVTSGGFVTPTAILDVNGKARSTAIYGFASSVAVYTTNSTVLVNHAGLVITLTVQASDLIKVDCACNLSNAVGTNTTYLTVANTAGAGAWVQTPNLIVSSGTGIHGGYSTGIFQASADGNVTFQAQWRVGGVGTGTAQNCNITAVVIGK